VDFAFFISPIADVIIFIDLSSSLSCRRRAVKLDEGLADLSVSLSFIVLAVATSKSPKKFRGVMEGKTAFPLSFLFLPFDDGDITAESEEESGLLDDSFIGDKEEEDSVGNDDSSYGDRMLLRRNPGRPFWAELGFIVRCIYGLRMSGFCLGYVSVLPPPCRSLELLGIVSLSLSIWDSEH